MQNNYFKAYMSEYTLGLVGAILTAHGLLFSFGGLESEIEAFSSINIIILLSALILAFAGTHQLNKNNRNGGVLLTTSGSLNLLGCIMLCVMMGISDSEDDLTEILVFTLLYTIACAALLLTGGIRVLAKNKPVLPSAAQGWYYPAAHPGYYPPPPIYPPAAVMPPDMSAGPPDSSEPPHTGYTRQPYAPNTLPTRKP